MPITKWSCPSCRREVELDHFQQTACGKVVHPDYAAAVLADRESQADRTGVRVSMASSCPRKYAIMGSEAIAVNPLDMLSALKGTAWHSLMETGAEGESWQCPQHDGAFAIRRMAIEKCCAGAATVGAEVEVAGTISGILLTGKIDRVRLVDGQLTGEDWKTGSDFRVAYIKGGKAFGRPVVGEGAPVEYKVQLSLYAELYRQQYGRTWDAATIWWAFSADSWAEPIEIMSVDACLDHQPYNCGYTVLELLHQAAQFAEGAVKWQDLPLVGKEIKFGKVKVGCDYCSVRDRCWTEDPNTKAPF